jgi:hypothetical protein
MNRSLLPSEVAHLLSDTTGHALQEVEQLAADVRSGRVTGFVVIKLMGDEGAQVRSAGSVAAGNAKFAWDVWYQGVVEQTLEEMEDEE